ncbi:MAG: tyrosine-type recombinase/integrase [Clostridiales Family XIII bacterium]|jgi:integrase|nr:tyrosine-type recombinase/integrase [Clostridiales Family XIII bacterium]
MTWKKPKDMNARDACKQAQRIADDFEQKLKQGFEIDPSITFSAFTTKWQSEYAAKQHRHTTIVREEKLLERINSHLGTIRLYKITAGDIRNCLSEIAANRQDKKCVCKTDLSKMLRSRNIKKATFVKEAQIAYSTFAKVLRGEAVSMNTIAKISRILNLEETKDYELVSGGGKYSGKTILHYYRLISKILTDAVRWEYILNNPCLRVEPPKVRKKRVDYLDDKQTKQFVSALKNAKDPYRTAVLLLLHLGCRRGELLGLQWDDIDLTDNTVDISKALLYTPERGVYMDETKTDESIRRLAIHPTVSCALKEYKAWQGEQRELAGDQWQDTNFVFTKWNGTPVRPDTFTSWVRRFVEKNNLPKITPKGLRHTSATLLIMNGLNVRSLANRLGHAKTSTTTDIYSHALKSMDEIAANILENAINQGFADD